MHTTTTTRTGTGTPVDEQALICPGCHEPALPQPPVLPCELGEQFSHRDGSPLCPDRRGRACEPMELTGATR